MAAFASPRPVNAVIDQVENAILKQDVPSDHLHERSVTLGACVRCSYWLRRCVLAHCVGQLLDVTYVGSAGSEYRRAATCWLRSSWNSAGRFLVKVHLTRSARAVCNRANLRNGPRTESLPATVGRASSGIRVDVPLTRRRIKRSRIMVTRAATSSRTPLADRTATPGLGSQLFPRHAPTPQVVRGRLRYARSSAGYETSSRSKTIRPAIAQWFTTIARVHCESADKPTIVALAPRESRKGPVMLQAPS